MTCFLLQSCLGVLPTPTLDTFSISQTLTTSQFWRHFKGLPILSPFQQPPMLPHAPSISTPHLTPPPKAALSSTSSKGNPETSSDSTPSDLKSGPTFFGNPLSHSGDRATPAASNIKGRVVKVICNVKGRWWSGSMGNAGRWP